MTGEFFNYRRGLCCDDEGALLLAFTRDLDKLSDFLMPTSKKDVSLAIAFVFLRVFGDVLLVLITQELKFLSKYLVIEYFNLQFGLGVEIFQFKSKKDFSAVFM